jgi:hypothetical protein
VIVSRRVQCCAGSRDHVLFEGFSNLKDTIMKILKLDRLEALHIIYHFAIIS